MNKLVLLNEVRKKGIENKNRLAKSTNNTINEKESNKSYISFREKFNCFKEDDEANNSKIRYNEEFNKNDGIKNLNKIIERIFLLNNTTIIELVNSLYNDDLNMDARMKYNKTKKNIDINEDIKLEDSNYDLKILAEDEYRKFEYRVQFHVNDAENIAIMITKVNLSNNHNVISLNAKKRKSVNKSEYALKHKYSKSMIILNSNIEVPDVYPIKSEAKGKNLDYTINIIKGWKYDFKQLSEKNMYLLFPLKALDIRKRLLNMKEDLMSKDLIKDEVYRFFKDMNKYLQRGKDDNLITDKDIIEFNSITIDLLNSFIKDKSDIFTDIKRDIETTFKEIVV
ncbi:hypothetical protein [Clostridium sp. YIM B02569]|uniref:hypothetical protein n=1 Tax=Clostridium sp. YIM B02569 TaxID=2911967 RepID=UPI001EEA1A28|nr:hypothetical protein [Clostridium sp. YIM B02569]